jgi:CxxC-x17-CxxC domain-containing protein
MGYSGNNNKSGGRFNRRSDRRDNKGDKPTMHHATCADCGDGCEIPFKPTGNRPVFCSDCFDKQGGGKSSKFGGDRRSKSRFEDRQMHDAVCAKCKKDCQIPFRPMSSKPVFCDDCFDKGKSTNKDSGEVMKQIKVLNDKVDKLIVMLSLKKDTKKTTKSKDKEVVKKVKAKETKKPKKVATKKAAPKKKVGVKKATKKTATKKTSKTKAKKKK